MPSFDFDASPADVRWAVTRGDDPRMSIGFFDAYFGEDHPDNEPSDLSTYTYTASVSTGRDSDHTLVVTPTVTVPDPLLGELVISMTDTQTELLTSSTYVWDLVENPDTTTETTLITGRMTVAGRATP